MKNKKITDVSFPVPDFDSADEDYHHFPFYDLLKA